MDNNAQILEIEQQIAEVQNKIKHINATMKEMLDKKEYFEDTLAELVELRDKYYNELENKET